MKHIKRFKPVVQRLVLAGIVIFFFTGHHLYCAEPDLYISNTLEGTNTPSNNCGPDTKYPECDAECPPGGKCTYEPGIGCICKATSTEACEGADFLSCSSVLCPPTDAGIERHCRYDSNSPGKCRCGIVNCGAHTTAPACSGYCPIDEQCEYVPNSNPSCQCKPKEYCNTDDNCKPCKKCNIQTHKCERGNSACTKPGEVAECLNLNICVQDSSETNTCKCTCPNSNRECNQCERCINGKCELRNNAQCNNPDTAFSYGINCNGPEYWGPCLGCQCRCKFDDDCPDGYTCAILIKTCVPFGNSCKDREDCGLCEQCKDGKCQKQDVVDCVQSSDCKAGFVCDICKCKESCDSSNTCTNAECKDRREVCVSQGATCQCQPACRYSTAPVCGGSCSNPTSVCKTFTYQSSGLLPLDDDPPITTPVCGCFTQCTNGKCPDNQSCIDSLCVSPGYTIQK